MTGATCVENSAHCQYNGCQKLIVTHPNQSNCTQGRPGGLGGKGNECLSVGNNATSFNLNRPDA